MAQTPSKTAAAFRPKRQWKPKRKDKNVKRRRQRKRWWRRNKARLSVKRRMRYRQLRNNSLFKAWRKKRVREKSKRRMRMASQMPEVPESWFIFSDDGILDIDMGYILDYDPDTEELLIHDVDEDEERVVSLSNFLRYSEFLEEADLDNFMLLMDQYYGEESDDLDIVDEDETAPPDSFEINRLPNQAIIERVAQRYLLTKARR